MAKVVNLVQELEKKIQAKNEIGLLLLEVGRSQDAVKLLEEAIQLSQKYTALKQAESARPVNACCSGQYFYACCPACKRIYSSSNIRATCPVCGN